MSCDCKGNFKKMIFCSRAHLEMLPTGYYYNDGYLFNDKNERVNREEAREIAESNFKIAFPELDDESIFTESILLADVLPVIDSPSSIRTIEAEIIREKK